jgi:hypothetical protein
MRTQTRKQWFRPVIIFWGKFFQHGYKFFWEKIGCSLLLCKFEKEASKKEKIVKVLKPPKLEKKNKKTLLFLWVR